MVFVLETTYLVVLVARQLNDGDWNFSNFENATIVGFQPTNYLSKALNDRQSYQHLTSLTFSAHIEASLVICPQNDTYLLTPFHPTDLRGRLTNIDNTVKMVS